MGITRREFLEVAAAGVAATASLAQAAAATPLPTRAFGRTGMTVSILGFGSGSRFAMYKDEDRALEALGRAIDLGITYIDTARGYSNGQSEERIGRLMPARRKEVTLATKLQARKGDDAKRQLELSLKRLRTDRLDVVHIHELKDLEDLAAIEREDGVLKALYAARAEKVVRAVGISCHAHPVALKTALERHDFDCTQMALNAALARMLPAPGGMKATPTPSGSFEELALPVAVKKNLGIIAMKVFGQDQLMGAAPVEKMVAYALSLPISLASIGMPKLEFIERNVELARAFRPMSTLEKEQLRDSIAHARKAAMHLYLREHVDA
jgi:predicted aldo/keto reductase-like oxidoreductase